jgi:TPP-dependent pyruvate/acetoin dehydrogenase alpha subunit
VDPVANYEHFLRERKLLDEGGIRDIRTQCEAALDAAIKYADGCTEPDMECLLSGVYKAEG